MKDEQQREGLKKEALQYILSIYMQRKNDEDVQFLNQNIKSTAQFAKNVSSDLNRGLEKESVQKNKTLYGKNSKRVAKTFQLKDIFLRVFRINNALIFSICVIQIIFGALTNNRQIYMDAVYAMFLLGCFLLIRFVTIYLNEKKKSIESYDKNKNEKYRIFRDGNYIQLPETKIVVGDIIELDYKEKVPASGLLITGKEIAMNEEIYGRKIQRKMSLQRSHSYIRRLSILQFKIDAEKQTLPSPIILRGSEQIYGSTYKILVLAVDEENLLEKYKIVQDQTFTSSVIRDWFQMLQLKIQKVLRIISVVYLILFLSLFGLKEFLQRKHLSVQNFMNDLFSVLLMSILGFSVFDTKCLRLFIETQVINYTENLNNPKQVDKYLTVEQIYISENNIVKYDEIIVCQIGLLDKENLISYEDLNNMSQKSQEKINQVLEGIGLKHKGYQVPKNGSNQIKQESSLYDFDHRLNQIVHMNTVDQKIFTLLSHRGKSQEEIDNEDENLKKSKLKIKGKQKQKITSFNTGYEENASNISLNRVTPLDEDHPLTGQKRRRFKKKQMSLSPDNYGPTQQSLKGYLGEYCKSRTKNIVEGIAQLAQQQSRTYYYQKYTISRIKRIKSVCINGIQLDMNKQKVQKVKRLARNIRTVQNLTPFLIGYSCGAYSKQSMNVLVGVVGVKINYENEIIKIMKELSSMGIRSTVLIDKREDEQNQHLAKQNVGMISKMTNNDILEEQDYKKIISSEYMSRGWISQQSQQIIGYADIRESSGILRCECCFLSKCDCKNRIQELSDIQSFLSLTQNAKIIHTVESQADHHYLKIGSQQIRNSVLMLTKYKADTIKILQDVKAGYYLPNILEKGLNVWYGFMFVSAICFYPLSLVSFGGVFASGDISLWILFIQSLPAIGNMHIQNFSKEKVENQTRKNKVVFSKKSTLSVFLLCLISTVVATIFYIHPTFIIEQSFTNIAADIYQKSGMVFERDCKPQFSIFLSDEFNKIQCVPPQLDPLTLQPRSYDTSKIPQFIYSQNVNFIFSYLCLNMLIFFMINFRNFSKLKVLVVYASMFAIYFFVIYVEPQIIHGRSDGLTPGQLAIVFGMSIITNLLIQCIAFFSNYGCAVCDTQEFQSILSFQENIQDHYSTKLKKYSSFETQTYTLN